MNTTEKQDLYNRPLGSKELGGNCSTGEAPRRNGTFGQAIEWMRQGHKVRRAHWKGYWFMSDDVNCQAPSPVGGGYLRGWNFKKLVVAVLADFGGCAPAQPYQTDWLANDWEVYYGE